MRRHAVTTLAVLLLAGCGGSDADTGAEQPPAPRSVTVEITPEGPRPETATVAAGQEVEVTFVNRLPARFMIEIEDAEVSFLLDGESRHVQSMGKLEPGSYDYHLEHFAEGVIVAR